MKQIGGGGGDQGQGSSDSISAVPLIDLPETIHAASLFDQLYIQGRYCV